MTKLFMKLSTQLYMYKKVLVEFCHICHQQAYRGKGVALPSSPFPVVPRLNRHCAELMYRKCPSVTSQGRLKMWADDRRCRVQQRLSIGECNNPSKMVFSIRLRGLFHKLFS